MVEVIDAVEFVAGVTVIDEEDDDRLLLADNVANVLVNEDGC